jgi:hydrogenase large subunit
MPKPTENPGKGKPKPPPPPPPTGSVAVIDPVTRLEGHLKITVTVDGGVVTDAKATGTLFRGFEKLLIGRHPADAQHITQRICGVCPVSHGMASVMALDAAYGRTVSSNSRIMRNLVMGANMLDSHILHFYHLTLPDFVDVILPMAPWSPSWNVDKRISASDSLGQKLVANYTLALDKRRQAHEMGAIFGGRLPHTPSYIPGGITTPFPTSTQITKFKDYLAGLVSFIQNTYINDVKAVANVYAQNPGIYPNHSGDYYTIGEGPGNLLAFGAFDQGSAGLLFPQGRLDNGTVSSTVNLGLITEAVTYSWYNQAELNPASGDTVPVDPDQKTTAYSWLKAPRYDREPYEAGPLARMWVKFKGDAATWAGGGISVMDRHLARAYEALILAQAMQTWVGQLNASTTQSIPSPAAAPASATAVGLTEAPRGALGHWLQISSGTISRYQIITPTCWNASPMDAAGVKGPIEQALIGTPVKDINQPIEVLRVIHSFDPCLSCAVHVMRPGEGKKVFAIPHFHGGEEIHTHEHDHRHCQMGRVHAHNHDHD